MTILLDIGWRHQCLCCFRTTHQLQVDQLRENHNAVTAETAKTHKTHNKYNPPL